MIDATPVELDIALPEQVAKVMDTTLAGARGRAGKLAAVRTM